MKVVIKVSGKILHPEEEVFPQVVARLLAQGIRLVIVHGGGPQLTQYLEELGRTVQFVEGLRVTTPQDMDVVEMVLSGLLNKMVVGMLVKNGVPACGISGRDGSLVEAEPCVVERAGKRIDLGRVGEVKRVKAQLIETLWEGGFVPVVSPVSGDGAGGALNVNADWVAAKIAQALGADKFVFFSDVPGVLRNPEDRNSLIDHLSLSEVERLLEEGVVSGGMIPKLKMLEEVIRGGVKEVFIGEGTEMIHLPQFVAGGSMRGTRIVPEEDNR